MLKIRFNRSGFLFSDMLSIENITFSYQKQPVLRKVCFELIRGNHLAVMGESGSGKSTLLKAIYGLLHLDYGTILWNGQKVLGPNYNLVPGEKTMKYVSQDFDLMPFTSVSENVGEHLSVFNRESHKDRIRELLEIIELQGYAATKVKNLSGGQQQRVALARALAQEPELLLLDEPFSSIDQFKKNELRHRLFPYLKAKGITVVTATHDPEDVLSFSDEILVLKDGEKTAHGSTVAVYQNPKEKHIATLFGMVNKLPVSLLKDYAKQDQNILIYPYEFEISSESGLEVTVRRYFYKGSHYLIEGIAETGQYILFHHKKKIESGVLVYLNIPLGLVNLRLNHSR